MNVWMTDNDAGSLAHFLTSGHRDLSSAWKASLPGTVATSLYRSHGPCNSLGFFTSKRYMSWTIRPSSRILPFLAKKSLIGVSFMTFMTSVVWSVPAACTARR